MHVQSTARTHEPHTSNPTISAQLSSTQSPNKTTLVSAVSENKASNIFTKALNYCKSIASKVYEWIASFFSSCSSEPSKLEIIELMTDDPEGAAKEFAATFDAHCNALIQAAYANPKDVNEGISGDNKTKFKDFCKNLKAELSKAEKTRVHLQQIAEIKAVLSLMIEEISKPLDLTLFAPHVEYLKDQIPALCTITLNFFKSVQLMLDTCQPAKDEHSKKARDALNELFGSYFPKIAKEMQGNAEGYKTFLSQFLALREINSGAIIALLKKEFKDQTTDVDIANLELCLDNNGYILNKEITDPHYSKVSFKLKDPMDYKIALLQAIAPEEFKVFLPLFVKDKDRQPIFENLFNQIKSTEEPITKERLVAALECLHDLFKKFEAPLAQ